MTIENTALGFYNDAYGMDDFPETGDPAPSDLAEQALKHHLYEHPELREIPRWAGYYPPPRPVEEIQAVLAQLPYEAISEETAAALGVSPEEFQDWAFADDGERYHAERNEAISTAARHMSVAEAQEELYLESLRQAHRCSLPVEQCPDCSKEERITAGEAEDRDIQLAAAQRVLTAASGNADTPRDRNLPEESVREQSARAAHAASATFQPTPTDRRDGGRAFPASADEPSPPVVVPAVTQRPVRRTRSGPQ